MKLSPGTNDFTIQIQTNFTISLNSASTKRRIVASERGVSKYSGFDMTELYMAGSPAGDPYNSHGYNR